MEMLSPKRLAEAIGVSESSLKRWSDDGRLEVSRTAGGHRRIALADAVQFIRSSGLPVLRPDLIGLADLKVSPDSSQVSADDADLLRDALLAGDADSVRSMVLSRYVEGVALARIADTMIAPAMHEIGTLWQHDESGIYLEHRATDLCIQAVQQVRALMPAADDDAPVAVGGAFEEDIYTMPTLLASVVLREGGWNAINLGPQTPPRVLASAAEEWSTSLVWVSISSDIKPDHLRRYVDELLEALAPIGAKLIVGGRAWPASTRPKSPDMHVARTMAELAAFATGVKAAY